MSHVAEEYCSSAPRVENLRKETINLLPELDHAAEFCSELRIGCNQLHKKAKSGCHLSSRGIGLDLNVAHPSLTEYGNPFRPMTSCDNSKSVEMSECGSTTGSLDDKDSMSDWKEMKKNGFVSSSYHRIPPPVPKPKQRGRKPKIDVMKQKMEIAKRERAERFARIAAPTGLLKDLNPGIINYVRNSKQVHSIIEALVRSEKTQRAHVNIKPASKMRSLSKEVMIESPKTNYAAYNFQYLGHENGLECSLTGNSNVSPHYIKNTSVNEENSDICLSQNDRKNQNEAFVSRIDEEDDILSLKLSSSSATKSTENVSSVSQEDSLASVSILSVKAATVASQWLDLLHRDVKGRLEALRRSKKKARSVIQNDLPYLFEKEFSSKDPHDTVASNSELLKIEVAEMHQARWSGLFSQMEASLSEEEIQLEAWLNQVTDMQIVCERGLQNDASYSSQWQQKLGATDNALRPRISETDLAVTAAAASIYSTCNFLMNKDKENVTCFPSH